MPVVERFAYFDHAAVGPLPDVSAAAIVKYAQEASQQGDVPWMTWSGQVSELRATAAEFLGSDKEEIALVANTTTGIGLVAEGFPWRDGDNVVLPANEFPSNILPWDNLKRLGVTVRRVPPQPSGELDWEGLSAALDARTRILALSWVGFSSGYRVDLDRAVQLAHGNGSLLMLDAIQGLGVFPIDVRQTPVDFLCADGHKWMLGPEGAGLLYVRGEHLDLLQPLGLGWNSLEAGAFDPASTRIKRTAARYEGGSTNMAGMLGFGASLRLLADQPSGAIAQAVLQNVDCLIVELERANFIQHAPPSPEQRSGIVGITWEAAERVGEAAYVAARKHCLARGVVLSVRGGRLRASLHAYNDDTDIQRLVDSLVDFRRSSVA
jgi:selenocysteine lyase/cysteine desulfurase